MNNFSTQSSSANHRLGSFERLINVDEWILILFLHRCPCPMKLREKSYNDKYFL